MLAFAAKEGVATANLGRAAPAYRRKRAVPERRITPEVAAGLSLERLMREMSYIRSLKVSKGWKTRGDVPRLYLENWVVLSDEHARRGEQLRLFD